MVNSYIFCGHLGSGKTEVALNFSLHLEKPVFLCDLDFVNPYYRSREYSEQLKSYGVELISSNDIAQYADIPALNRKVSALFYRESGNIVLDIGGDDKGARILGRLRNDILRSNYKMFWVLNPLRPETSQEKGILEVKAGIERVAGLEFTSVIFNPNLSYQTDIDIIKESIENLNSLSIPVEISYISVLKSIVDANRSFFQKLSEEKGWEIISLQRFLLNPWEER